MVGISLSGCGGAPSGAATDGSRPTDAAIDGPSDAPASDRVDAAAPPTAVSGAVQEGPFVRGSSVTVRELDSTLAPTGRTFNGSTNDDEGDFTIPVDVSTQFVEVTASGYFFDELTNQLSSGPLTLRALADLTSSATVDVTLLTSASDPLVRNLVAGGATFPAATAHAESAVLSALGFSASSLEGAFSSVALTGSGAVNGEALAASLIIEQFARLLGSSDVAPLSELLREVGTETADSGSDSTLNALYTELCRTIWSIAPATVRANLTSYYASVGASVIVPPFEQFLCGCGIVCGSTCVDDVADSENCGACGNVCGAGQSCRLGVCV